MIAGRTKRRRNLVEDLRGASRLAVAATKGVTDVVEAMHVTIAGGPDILGRPLEGPVRLLVGPVYASIRGVTHLVGASLDVALARLSPLLESVAGPERDTVLAVVNGVLGDYLRETENPLAIEMTLRRGGRTLTLEREALRKGLPDATGRILVFVHGSSMSDFAWSRGARAAGEPLTALGYTPVYLHYNSGLHISTNGRAFADLLEQLVREWPTPVESIAMVAHSMGGLVARSAAHAGEVAGHSWRTRLDALVSLGSPHHGAPLERGGSIVELFLGVSRYSAPLAALGRIRSAGVTDLRFGNVLDEHWAGKGRFVHGRDTRTPLPLPEGVRCYAVAATTAAAPRKHLPGDGLVPVASALGQHERSEMALGFAEDHTWVGFGMGHLDLLDRPEIDAKLAEWLAPR